MKICHVSDCHGELIPLADGDVVVSSGDFMPNRSFGLRVLEEPFQRWWLEQNCESIARWLGGRTLLMTSGNHDFVDAAAILWGRGVDAVGLDDHLVEWGGLNFWGHPWTPTFYDWAWMCGRVEMGRRVDGIPFGDVDVLVSHGPMYGVFDRNRDGDNCGCRELRRGVLGDGEGRMRTILHGHIHEAVGWKEWGGVRVSNAARMSRAVDIV